MLAALRPTPLSLGARLRARSRPAADARLPQLDRAQQSTSDAQPSQPFGLHLALRSVSVKAAGRYFVTLSSTGPDRQEHRTEVSDVDSCYPAFKPTIYTFRVSDPEAEMITVSATKLAFSRGAVEVGRVHMSVAALLACREGGFQECTLELPDAAGHVQLAWTDDRAAVEEQAAADEMVAAAERLLTAELEAVEKQTAQRRVEEQAAAEQAEAEHAAAEQAVAEEERAAEELAVTEQAAVEQVAAKRAAAGQAAAEQAAAAERAAAEQQAAEWLAAGLVAQEKADEAAVIALQEAAEQARLSRGQREAERQEAARTATQEQLRRVIDNVSAKWESVLAAPVTLTRDDGLRIELTGRQVVGISDRAKESQSSLVAFMQAGRRITLSTSVVEALRVQVEAQMDHRTVQGLQLSLPSAPRAATAAATSSTTDPIPAASPRHSTTAPAGSEQRSGSSLHGGQQPLPISWLRATSKTARAKVAPAAE